MKFETPLLEGRLVKRYKRFFADIEYDGKVITAHVPNTGSMMGCNSPNSPCRFSPARDPKRKLQYTLEMVHDGSTWIGVNTSHSNRLVWELWQSQSNSPWSRFDRGQREVKISSRTRIDMVLWESNVSNWPQDRRLTMEAVGAGEMRLHLIEIKNVSLARDGVALFPDAVTERGQKHLIELMTYMEQGHSAELIFTIQRNDCHSFSPADTIDPHYGKLLRQAIALGLKVSPLPSSLSRNELRLLPLPLKCVV